MSTHFRITRTLPRFVASAPPATFAATASALAPSAWYRLGESSGTTMTDSSGNAHDGSYTSVTLGTTGLIAGDTDTAATFSGSNSNGSVNAATWMDAPTALSVFIVGVTTSTANMILMSRDTNVRIWQLAFNAGKFSFVKISGGVVTAESPLTYNDGTAHDFGATYDGSNIRIYVDGAKVKTVAAAGSLGTSLGRLLVGARTTSASIVANAWVGVLDEALYEAGTVWADSDFAALHAARV